jgi:hypothetical protein
MNKSTWVRCGAAFAVAAVSLFHVTAVSAATIRVKAGDNLQTAINAAQSGDTLLLEAGATFSGNFVLPVKTGTEFITIRTDVPDSEYPAGVRITPTTAAKLARIKSPNNGPALATVPGSHHWRLVLLEFAANWQGYGEIMQLGDGSRAQNTTAMVPHHLELDRVYIHGDPIFGQKRGIALNAADVTIRNCYISDIKAVGMDTQAIGGWNGPGPFTIENNYLEASGENFMLGGADPAIPNLVSDGVVFRHNYLTKPLSWKEPIVPTPSGVSATETTGGALAPGTYSYTVVARRQIGGGMTARSTASASVTVAVSAGNAVSLSWPAVEGVTQYYVYGRTPGALNQYWAVTGTSFTDTGAAGSGGTSPTSIGDRWLVKNLFELKNARNVVVEYNIIENNWPHGQSGYAIMLTPRNQDGTCTWCVVENVTFNYNVLRNIPAAINILGSDNIAPSKPTKNIEIRHNLIYNMRASMGGTAWFVIVTDGTANLVVDHNTVDADGSAFFYVWSSNATVPYQLSPFQFTNNALRHGLYGFNGATYSFGNGILNYYAPGAVFRGNWIQGGYASRYPADNYFTGTFADAFVDVAAANYQAAPGGVLAGKATDGTNIGADLTTLLEATKNVESGRSKSKPTTPTNLRIIK